MGRNIFTSLIVLFLLVVMAACGQGGTNAAADNNPSPENGQANGQYNIRLAHNMPETSGVHQGALRFKEIVEEESEGRLVVEIFSSQQLGSMREQIEGVQLGSIEMSIQPVDTLSAFVEDLQIISFPYLWPSEEVMWTVLDGEVGQDLLSTMEEYGFKGLGVWAQGFKAMTSIKKIETPEDLKGLKMRVIPSELLIAQYEAWGANPTPIDFAELYNSLQQGVVDGQENPLETIYVNKYYEVQDYLTLSEHGYLAYVFTINRNWFENLPADLQKIIVEAESEARQLQRELTKNSNLEILDELKDTGIEVIEIDEEQKDSFRQKVLTVHQDFTRTERQQELLNRIYDAIQQAQ
mgnify:CR=1 FL=1